MRTCPYLHCTGGVHGRTFAKRENLKEHIRRKHPGFENDVLGGDDGGAGSDGEARGSGQVFDAVAIEIWKVEMREAKRKAREERERNERDWEEYVGRLRAMEGKGM